MTDESRPDTPHIRAVQPAHFAPPRGYANGVVTTGPLLHVAGQIGWQPDGTWASEDFVDQFARALDNVIDVVRAAGGHPAHIVRMTVYVTDLDAYRKNARPIGAAWRARMGKHYPAMALVGVAGLVESRAQVEIEAVAALGPDADAQTDNHADTGAQP
jgi:enamine deaminase RidA (YjgF/YER057c/UK114 family)